MRIRFYPISSRSTTAVSFKEDSHVVTKWDCSTHPQHNKGVETMGSRLPSTKPSTMLVFVNTELNLSEEIGYLVNVKMRISEDFTDEFCRFFDDSQQFVSHTDKLIFLRDLNAGVD